MHESETGSFATLLECNTSQVQVIGWPLSRDYGQPMTCGCKRVRQAEGETGKCNTSHSALDGGIGQTPNYVAIIINFQLILSCFFMFSNCPWEVL